MSLQARRYFFDCSRIADYTSPFRFFGSGNRRQNGQNSRAGYFYGFVVAFPPSDAIVTRQIQEHDADRFSAGFAPAVARMASDIAYQASKDPNLQSFATPGDQALNSL